MKKELKTLLNLLSASAIFILPLGLAAQDGEPEEVPPIDIPAPEHPEAPPAEVQDFLAALADFRAGIQAILDDETLSGADRGAAIRDWVQNNRPMLDMMEDSIEEVNVAAAVEDVPSELPDRPEASANMRNLNELYTSKLAALELDNVDLEQKLASIQADREQRLAELEAAREERLQSMEEAREFARQMREEARENSQGSDRRPGDD